MVEFGAERDPSHILSNNCVSLGCKSLDCLSVNREQDSLDSVLSYGPTTVSKTYLVVEIGLGVGRKRQFALIRLHNWTGTKKTGKE